MVMGKRMKGIIASVVAVLVVATSILGAANAKKSDDLEVANTTISTLENLVYVMEEEAATLLVDLSKVQVTLDIVATERAELQSELVVILGQLSTVEDECDLVTDQLDSAKNLADELKERTLVAEEALLDLEGFYYDIFIGEQPPWRKPGDQSIILEENTSAIDVTWDELILFLEEDITDKYIYDLSSYVCSGYAEDLHNNAEAVGIRAAFVYIAFEDNPIGHVFNAFNTTDRGLVFIDSTNSHPQYWGLTGDKVAYVQIGKEYGAVHLSLNPRSFQYSNYEGYLIELRDREIAYQQAAQIAMQRYEAAQQTYSNDIFLYTKELEAYYAGVSSMSYSALWDWYSRLVAQGQQLDSMATEINHSFTQTAININMQFQHVGFITGSVTEVEMYW